MKKVGFSILSMLLIQLAVAQLRVPGIFKDHMVLQRSMEVRFWGKSSPDSEVEVSIDGFSSRTKTAEDGSWTLLYPSHSAGGPYEVVITSGDTLSYQDVWFGDVWVASGQSNMEWKMGWGELGAEREIAEGNYPKIRFFDVENQFAFSPQEVVPAGEWKLASPETVPDFSAVAWYFAKLNHLEKGVPVGIISSEWGGTPAETWTSAERLLEVPGYKKMATEMLDPAIDWSKIKSENLQRQELKSRLIGNKDSFLKLRAHMPEFDDTSWGEVSLPTKEPLNDFVWIRKEVSLKPGDTRLYLGDLNQLAWVYFNGTEVSYESWQDTTGIIDIPNQLVKRGKNTLAVRVVNDWNNQVWIGTPGAMWIENAANKINLEGTWKFNNTIEPKMPEVKRLNWLPGAIYNSMIHPIAGYSIKGALWYQGESNADKPELYNELFETMIEDWRIRWKQGNFPFLFVQLANYMARAKDPGESNWAELREAQYQTLELPKTGMATIIDIGEADDIHPRNKKDVGYRLWQAAQKVAFQEDVVYSGPTYSSHRVEGNEVIVSFDHLGSGLVSETDAVTGFALAGEDGQFYWATGVIKGNEVVLQSPEVETPLYIRYGWADNPEVSLYNREKLPAVPFRTDSN